MSSNLVETLHKEVLTRLLDSEVGTRVELPDKTPVPYFYPELPSTKLNLVVYELGSQLVSVRIVFPEYVWKTMTELDTNSVSRISAELLRLIRTQAENTFENPFMEVNIKTETTPFDANNIHLVEYKITCDYKVWLSL
jgi:hypothetical protein